MTAAELLQSVNRAGFALRCEGDAILVAPAGRLPEELREAVKTHRRELLSLLHQRPVSVVPPPASPDPRLFDRPEAERRLAALRADVAAAEARQPGGRFPPRVGRVVRMWLEVAEGYVANGDTEAARGWDAMRLLDGAAVYARDEAGGQAYRREAAARPTDLLDPEWAAGPGRIRPGVRLFFSDDDGRPCKAEDAFMWCWAGAPQWCFTVEHFEHHAHPVPPHRLVMRAGARLRCGRCARHELRVTSQQFSNGTTHLRCECAVCGRFLKHLKPPPGNLDLEYRLAEGAGCGT